MKTSIHPDYHALAQVTCACGNSFQVGSTLSSLSIEICSNCHPVFSGKKKIIDTAGRVERFASKLKKKDTISATAAPKGRKVKRAIQAEKKNKA